MAIVRVKKVKKNGWLPNIKAYANSMTRVGCPIDAQGYQVTGLDAADQTRLEEALGHPKGTLAKGNMRDEKLVNFWTTYTVDFEDSKPMILDTEYPDQELAYLFLKAQRKVAKTLAELKINGFAQFVIFNEEDEASRDNKRGKNKRMAYALFESLSTDEMKDILMVYGRPADSTSPAMIENQLDKLVEEDPQMFMTYANDPAKKTKVFILNLVRAGILSKKGPAFSMYGTDEILAYSMDELVKFLDSKANNGKFLQLKEALKDR